MEVKTKFEINQKVWFMSKNTPTFGYVTSIFVKNIGLFTSDEKAKLVLGEAIDSHGEKYSIEHDPYFASVPIVEYSVLYLNEDECTVMTVEEDYLFESKTEMRDKLFADEK